MQTTFQSLVKYFAEDPRLSCEEFFRSISTYVRGLDAAHNDIRTTEENKAKAAARAAQAQQRREAVCRIANRLFAKLIELLVGRQTCPSGEGLQRKGSGSRRHRYVVDLDPQW